jgi:hypothetical protein
VGTVPLCATQPLTFTQATIEKEILTMLRFERDSAWPLKITAASALDEATSLSITDDSEWTDDDGSIEWIWDKFYEAAKADQITVRPALSRPGSTCDMFVRK